MGKGYDKKVKVTRILLADYLALKRISQLAGIPMPEALHRLIEHQAQLPLLDMAAKPVSAIATQPVSVITSKTMPAFRSASMITIATNGSKVTAFRIKPGRVRYD
ncbi:hypothetical protein ES703_92832 [subsurface metagenome]